MERFDIVVAGSGFGGSLMSMIARRLGYSVLLLEKGKHPRFAIGESSTPLTNWLMEELAQKYDLPGLLPFAKWGTWQNKHPEVGCGLKRGFSFFHHVPGQLFSRTPLHDRELLVAASPNDRIADTHWYRPDFDHFFVRKAERCGVVYRDETDVQEVAIGLEEVTLRTSRAGFDQTIRAKLIIDATGPNGLLRRSLGIPEEGLARFPETQAIYTHFRNVRRLEELPEFDPTQAAPYPIDDSAVHHLFPGGWVWVLRFNNGITSAGVAATRAVADELHFSEPEKAWERLLRRFPTIGRQFEAAQTILPWVYQNRVAFRLKKVAGPRWVLLPSAGGFIDPLLSTGFPLTLLGIARVADLLGGGGDPGGERFQTYEKDTLADLRATEQLVAALYGSLDKPEQFKWVSFVYFAAMLYTETLCRLGKRADTAPFLLREQPFWADAERCFEMLRQNLPGEIIQHEIAKLIEPFDLGGLLDPARRNWHPADSQTLIGHAHKAGVTAEELAGMLRKIGA